jgi:O-antigen/teichoic acid export membrane protein
MEAKQAAPHVGLARGTLLVMAAEALAFPAGLATTILLTRHLTTHAYGALALGLAAVAWLEWTVTSLFSSAAFKLIAEHEDWHEMAAAVIRSFLVAGLLTGVVVFAGAGLAATLFDVPSLAAVLRVLAIDIPLFVTAQAYRTVLVGRGRHRARAAVAATRWTLRAILIGAGVLLGFSVTWLAALFTAATAIELMLARQRVGRVQRRTASAQAPIRRLIRFAAPLAVSAICLRLFDRLDLFMIRLFGEPLETVAAYGVSQNLALAPGLFGSAFVPGLIAALSYHFAMGDRLAARRTSTGALRVAIVAWPAAALAAGAAPVLVETFFGTAYRPAAPFFAMLVIAGAAMLALGVSGGILLAAGRPEWTLAITAPTVPLAALAHLLVIPRAGATGAAMVTTTTAIAAAIAAFAAVHHVVGAPLPLATLIRALAVGALAFWAGKALLPGPGIPGLFAALALAIAVAAVLALSGELTSSERSNAVRWASAALRSARKPAA